MSRCVPGRVPGHSVILTQTNGKIRERTPFGQTNHNFGSLLSSREQGSVVTTTLLC